MEIVEKDKRMIFQRALAFTICILKCDIGEVDGEWCLQYYHGIYCKFSVLRSKRVTLGRTGHILKTFHVKLN